MSPSVQPYHLLVITGSVRAGRRGPAVAEWFTGRARDRPDVVVRSLDLADLTLPDDLGGGGDAPALAAAVGAADAVVVVTPEYNHGYPGALKTAIDTVDTQWRAKPVGFVSYGGVSGGTRAVEQLRQVFAEVHAVTVREAVSLVEVWEQLDDHGSLPEGLRAERAAHAMLERLGWWARVLRPAREHTPYVA